MLLLSLSVLKFVQCFPTLIFLCFDKLVTTFRLAKVVFSEVIKCVCYRLKYFIFEWNIKNGAGNCLLKYRELRDWQLVVFLSDFGCSPSLFPIRPNGPGISANRRPFRSFITGLRFYCCGSWIGRFVTFKKISFIFTEWYILFFIYVSAIYFSDVFKHTHLKKNNRIYLNFTNLFIN